MKGSIFLAREGRGDEGFEFLHMDSGFREKGSSICEKAMKGSSFFAGSELSPAQKSKKIRGKKNIVFMYTFTFKNSIFRRRRPRAFLLDFSTLRVQIGFGQVFSIPLAHLWQSVRKIARFLEPSWRIFA